MSAISTRLYVGGFPPDVRESELAARFAPFGKVCATQLICDSATGAPRGFGYVTLEAEEAAVERCLKVYRGTKWRGQPLHVQPANESYLARLQREWQQAAADEAEAALAAVEAEGGEEAEGAAPLWGRTSCACAAATPRRSSSRSPARPTRTCARLRRRRPSAAATTLSRRCGGSARLRRRRRAGGRVRAGG